MIPACLTRSGISEAPSALDGFTGPPDDSLLHFEQPKNVFVMANEPFFNWISAAI